MFLLHIKAPKSRDKYMKVLEHVRRTCEGDISYIFESGRNEDMQVIL